MKTKNIKVAYSTRYNQKDICTVPKIQMEGKWLEELGFSVGSTIAVEYEENSIRIRPLTEEELLIKEKADWEIKYKQHIKDMRIAEETLAKAYHHAGKVAESHSYSK